MLGYLSSYVMSPAANTPSAFPYCDELPKALPDPGDIQRVQSIVDESYTAVENAIKTLKWAPLPFADPDAANGSADALKLFSADGIGYYHPIMASFSVLDATVDKCISVIHAPTIDERKKISANIAKFEILHQIDENTHVQRVEYTTPPVIAVRDFCFLVKRKELPDNTTMVWGCSVDTPAGAIDTASGLVRGTSMWGWKFIQVGNNVLMSYVHVFNPCGWVPSFIIAWLKGSVSDELIAARRYINGKEANVTQISLLDCGATEEEIEKEIKEHNSKVAKGATS